MAARPESGRGKESGHARPGDFILVFQQEVTDCGLVERLVHEWLSEHRLPNKEFFKVPVGIAIRVLIDASEQFRPS